MTVWRLLRVEEAIHRYPRLSREAVTHTLYCVQRALPYVQAGEGQPAAAILRREWSCYAGDDRELAAVPIAAITAAAGGDEATFWQALVDANLAREGLR